MARLPDVPDEALPRELRDIAAAQVHHYGTVLNSTRQTGHAPHIGLGQAAMSKALARSGKIPTRLSYLINLRVAAIVGCPL